ncbi:MAG: hypothetical protein DRN99_09485, partial [Thermoproteota archaeon]
MKHGAAALLLLLAALPLAQLSSQQQLQVSASLDKEHYTYGEVLHVSGAVTQGGAGASSATVLMQFISPPGSLIFAWAVT